MFPGRGAAVGGHCSLGYSLDAVLPHWLISAVKHGLGCSLDVREFIVADNHGLGCSLDVHGRNEDRRGLGCSLDAALRQVDIVA